MFENRLEPKLIQTQKLILSPQLRQYLKLLPLPLLELQATLEQELDENPALEEEPGDQQPEQTEEEPTELEATKDKITEELDFQEKFETLDRMEEEFKETLYEHDTSSPDEIKDLEKKVRYQESLISKPPTLGDYLLWQASFLNLNEEEMKIAQELIGNINEDGYIQVELEELVRGLSQPLEKIEKVLSLLQSLDPPGICAKNLKEALLIQLKKKEEDTSLAQRIVSEYLPWLEKWHLEEIAKQLNEPVEKIKQACEMIKHLEPKPGRIFYYADPVSIVPDATVYKADEESNKYSIEIYDETLPRLRISRTYRQMLKDKKLDAKTKKFVREKINNAMWLIKAVAQRKSTLRRITEEIVKVQNEFFEKGFSYLKPLTLKDIARKVNIHESTISRALANKYINTPQGTIPYKSFFSTKLETQEGETSQKSIMEKIKKLVTEEDSAKPLNDTKIQVLLQREGIKIARRTVAKYREMLKILPSYLRKRK